MGKDKAEEESKNIEENISSSSKLSKSNFKDLFSPALRYIMGIGLLLGILQQATGINAIYFYATSFLNKQVLVLMLLFSSGVLLSLTTVVFTILAMYLVDKMGRRPLLLIGITGISISLLTCAYGFNNAKYKLGLDDINSIVQVDSSKLENLIDIEYDSDVNFKNDLKKALGNQVYAKNEGNFRVCHNYEFWLSFIWDIWIYCMFSSFHLDQ